MSKPEGSVALADQVHFRSHNVTQGNQSPRAGRSVNQDPCTPKNLLWEDNFPFGFKGMTHLGKDKSDLDVGLATSGSYRTAISAH